MPLWELDVGVTGGVLASSPQEGSEGEGLLTVQLPGQQSFKAGFQERGEEKRDLPI